MKNLLKYVLIQAVISSIVLAMVLIDRTSKVEHDFLQRTVETISFFIYADEFDRYLEEGKDESYYIVEEKLQELRTKFNFPIIYICKFTQEGSIFIFDVEGNYYIDLGIEDGPYPLGYLDSWEQQFEEIPSLKEPWLNGEEIKPIVVYDSKYGNFIVFHQPLQYSNGEKAKGFYVAIDIPLNLWKK